MFFMVGFFFLLGLFTGSFLNVVIYRLPRGETVVWGRSRCPACEHVLAWCDLVPVASYLALRGRCRYCGARISPRYPVVELLTGAVFAALFYRYGPVPALVKYLFLGAVLIAAAFIDLEHYLIPDRLVLAGFAAAIVLGFAARDVGVWSSLAGSAAGAGFLFAIVVFSKGGMGCGDVKLAAVAGLFIGWPLAALALFLAVITGGLVAAVLLLFRLKGPKDAIPFGPFIAAGTLAAALWGSHIIDWYKQVFLF
ncbi:prepilin peptidase [Thermosediminibacter oceani]|uniref:Prepilin leader peptidase/N-methyltransferase n=1 Tax=Thermosediminibacter oceani (strain ATCC BAA-1034 / DSM 16646 / JW/IW-1228P) TaxID=555079 RepID=D9RZA1_THEOJ|nr:A24 family peptidase [Thermosediminibacter oceani]ADL08655.1 type 4 prepilin peptidase 1 [Thermosediminibacter oceani DSM 16646]